MMARFNVLLLALFSTIAVAVAQPADPLPSWNDGAAKKAITDFVAPPRKVACSLERMRQ